MKKLKIVLGVLVGLFVVVTAVGFLLPSKVRVERSIVVNAPSASIYPLIANLKSGMTQWTPFGPEMDPEMKVAYSGPDEGVGAAESWVGPRSGDGNLMITKADPARGIEYDMVTMQESFRLHGSMLCEPAGEGTKVSWVDTMEVIGNPYKRYFGIFHEGLMGGMFEKGLAKLKQTAEAAPKAAGEAQAKQP
jgi:polyketide cyclase/dehydrase/lipid transport protein